MKLEVNRRSLRIIAESDQDRAFLEDTLGVGHDDTGLAMLHRCNYFGTSTLYGLEVRHASDPPLGARQSTPPADVQGGGGER